MFGAFSILGGCKSTSIENADVNQFETLVNTQDVQVLDVRTAEEFSDGFIPGAINIDVYQPDFLEQVVTTIDKKQPVAIYCRSGKRSMMAAQQLVKAHYKVINLDGGIMAWDAAGKTVTHE